MVLVLKLNILKFNPSKHAKRNLLGSGSTRMKRGSLLKVSTCHPGSLIIMVIKTMILGTSFSETARLL